MLKRTRLSLAVSAAFGAGLFGFAPVSLAQTPTVTQDRVEITDGVAAGDTLITSGLLQLKPGAPVTIATQ